MLTTKETRPATRTLQGWAIEVLQEVGAIRECEEHGWMQDGADPHARERALEIARKSPPPGVSPQVAARGRRTSARFDRRYVPRVPARMMVACRRRLLEQSRCQPAHAARSFQSLPLLIPADVFGSRSLSRASTSAWIAATFSMLPLGRVQRRLRLIDGLCRRSRSFCLAASSLARSRSRRFCSFSKATEALRSAAWSTAREEGFCLVAFRLADRLSAFRRHPDGR